MAEYIDREAFIADKRWLYCTECDKRKGKKRGKYVTLYEIGEAPCRSCWVDDMLDEMEVYPAADVVAVVRCKDCVNSIIKDEYEIWCDGRGRPMLLVEPDGFCDKGRRE